MDKKCWVLNMTAFLFRYRHYYSLGTIKIMIGREFEPTHEILILISPARQQASTSAVLKQSAEEQTVSTEFHLGLVVPILGFPLVED